MFGRIKIVNNAVQKTISLPVLVLFSGILISGCTSSEGDITNKSATATEYAKTASVAAPQQPLHHETTTPSGTIDNPIVDSAMTFKEAVLNKKPWNCTNREANRLVLLDVLYFSFDGKVHKGQIVIHRDFTNDIQNVFRVILETKFPIYSAVPARLDEISNHPRNTCGFAYRNATGRISLSKHAFGRAVDINPWLNPYINYTSVFPTGGSYRPGVSGTLTSDHPVVKKFKELGWKWGGDFKYIKDYQHFQK